MTLPRAVTRPRKNKLSRLSRMRGYEIRALATLHHDGDIPIRMLARQTWRRFGYDSEQQCMDAIYRAFRIEGHRVYKFCRGCGCRTVLQTPGCKTCSRRFVMRRQVGVAEPLPPAGCRGCGVPLDDRTRGCVTCSDRHWHRRRQGRPYKPSPATCIRCRKPYDEYTPGCSVCAARRRRRHLRLVA